MLYSTSTWEALRWRKFADETHSLIRLLNRVACGTKRFKGNTKTCVGRTVTVKLQLSHSWESRVGQSSVKLKNNVRNCTSKLFFIWQCLSMANTLLTGVYTIHHWALLRLWPILTYCVNCIWLSLLQLYVMWNIIVSLVETLWLHVSVSLLVPKPQVITRFLNKPVATVF